MSKDTNETSVVVDPKSRAGTWEATMNLRIYHIYNYWLLQREWVNRDGTRKWRNIPEAFDPSSDVNEFRSTLHDPDAWYD